MGKNFLKAKEAVSYEALNLQEAVKKIKEISFSKFDESVDLSINLNIDTRKADQLVRGVVVLPNGRGKAVRVALISKNSDKYKDCGAEIIGGQEVKIDFDICVATPDSMPLVSQVARILGPKGLMPNPKLGTVTMDVNKAVEKLKKGQVEFRADKKGVVNLGIGKISFEEAALVDNIKDVISAINNAKPQGIKGSYIKSIFVSATMTPSVELNISTLNF